MGEGGLHATLGGSADVRTVAVVGASGLGGGSNWFDLGFALDSDSSRLVVMGALDGLVKGGAPGTPCRR